MKKRKPVATQLENIVFEAPNGETLKFIYFHSKNKGYSNNNFNKKIAHKLLAIYASRNINLSKSQAWHKMFTFAYSIWGVGPHTGLKIAFLPILYLFPLKNTEYLNKDFQKLFPTNWPAIVHEEILKRPHFLYYKTY